MRRISPQFPHNAALMGNCFLGHVYTPVPQGDVGGVSSISLRKKQVRKAEKCTPGQNPTISTRWLTARSFYLREAGGVRNPSPPCADGFHSVTEIFISPHFPLISHLEGIPKSN